MWFNLGNLDQCVALHLFDLDQWPLLRFLTWVSGSTGVVRSEKAWKHWMVIDRFQWKKRSELSGTRLERSIQGIETSIPWVIEADEKFNLGQYLFVYSTGRITACKPHFHIFINNFLIIWPIIKSRSPESIHHSFNEDPPSSDLMKNQQVSHGLK